MLILNRFNFNGKYSYLYSFCNLLENTGNPNCDGQAAVCEYLSGADYSSNLGTLKTWSWQMRSDALHPTPSLAIVAYSEGNGGGHRRSVAYLHCDETATDINFTSAGYTPPHDVDDYLLYVSFTIQNASFIICLCSAAYGLLWIYFLPCS